MTLRALSCLIPLLLAACGTGGDFPSLAPRPIEALADQPEPDRTPPPRAIDRAVEAQVAELARQVDAADSAWTAGLRAARTATARAGSRTARTEAWIAAQQAIGRLDTLRSPLTDAVEALDRLRFAQAESARPVDTARLDALWARATSQLAAQNAAYAELAATVPVG